MLRAQLSSPISCMMTCGSYLFLLSHPDISKRCRLHTKLLACCSATFCSFSDSAFLVQKTMKKLLKHGTILVGHSLYHDLEGIILFACN